MEPSNDKKDETEVVQEDIEAMENGDHDPTVQPNTTFLLELNLLIIVLSLFSLSSEDGISCEKEEVTSTKDHELKACISRLPKRQEMHETRLAGRQAQRSQPMIKDCRHGRRM